MASVFIAMTDTLQFNARDITRNKGKYFIIKLDQHTKKLDNSEYVLNNITLIYTQG